MFHEEGWNVECIVDDDGHLNVYIERDDLTESVVEIESGQGDGIGEQLALRFTTREIEQEYFA